MPATYEAIASTTLSSGASAITFSSIPSTYTDLRIVFYGVSATGNSMYVRINGDTGTNYSITELYTQGSAAFSSRSSNSSVLGIQSTNFATTPSFFTVDAFSYTSSNFKTFLITALQDNNGSGGAGKNSGQWRSTSAINAISVLQTSGTIAAGSIATIYGIKAA